MHVLIPPPAPPLRFERPTAALNQSARGRVIRRAMRALGFDDPILWVHDFDAAGVVRAVEHRVAIAYISDDHPTSHAYRANPGNRVRSMRRCERALLRSVDLVITTAPSLGADKRRLNANSHCVMHGVDADLLARAMDPALSPAPALAALRPPVIGMVGQVNERIDVPLLRSVARARPDWSLALIGPARDAVRDALAGADNIHLLGPVSREQLPRWLKPMAVGIVPYVLNEHTLHMHPLKALEYLAAGKPVVATPLPTLAFYGDNVALAAGPGAFEGAIEAALARTGEAHAKQRAHYAAAHTWDQALDDISRLVDATLAGRAHGGAA
jgi:glycosyltransferase involved in cell wall biosynthesis